MWPFTLKNEPATPDATEEELKAAWDNWHARLKAAEDKAAALAPKALWRVQRTDDATGWLVEEWISYYRSARYDDYSYSPRLLSRRSKIKQVNAMEPAIWKGYDRAAGPFKTLALAEAFIKRRTVDPNFGLALYTAEGVRIAK